MPRNGNYHIHKDMVNLNMPVKGRSTAPMNVAVLNEAPTLFYRALSVDGDVTIS